ncbi:MAG: PorV/PorQ family protein, partial [Candidatus Marinimicrobia bacterium]|nr:PorV/PorQ family protein [Candidatus Neomarinimicrobiota bacterium]
MIPKNIPAATHSKFFTIAIISTLVFCGYAFGDLDVGAKFAGEFMTLGADGRSSGMGETGVAVGGLAGAYWNPALITSIDGGGILAMHADRFSGIVKYDFITAAQRYSDREVFGLTIFRLGIDDIPLTALQDPNSPISEDNYVYVRKWTSDSELALLGTYAMNWRENIALGVNGKIISKSVGDNSALGIGFDIGATYNPIKSLQLGARISDVTTTFLGWDTGHNELILPSFGLGVAKSFHHKKLEADVTLAVDMIVRGENRGSADQFDSGILSGDAHFGLEYMVKKVLALRAGMDREYFTAGAGLHISRFDVDYAYQSH